MAVQNHSVVPRADSGDAVESWTEAPNPDRPKAPAEAGGATLVRRYPYAGLALVIALIFGAIWMLEGGLSTQAADEAATVTLTGFTGGETPRIGQPAPEFTLEALDGSKVALADLRGRVVMINFWATWCPPCRGEMPDLEALSTEYREAGLVVLAVNLQEERGAVQRYADSLGLTFPIVLDRSGAVATRYNLTALPSSYFLDRDGVVRDRNIGPLTAKGLKSKVGKLLQ